jgi:hypothetical protein
VVTRCEFFKGKDAMVSHVDRGRTGSATKKYRENHERIYGPPRGAGKVDEAKQRRMRAERHNREVADGKKDAQYYIDHEVRVSSNPNFKPSPPLSKAYNKGWDEIYSEKPKKRRNRCLNRKKK